MSARGALLMLLATLLVATQVQAELLEKDLAAAGDALLLLDTESGLEWLDLTATANLSYDDLIAGAGPVDFVNDYGFRFATTTELGDLWSHAGIVDVSGAWKANNYSGVAFLLETMGCTSACDSGPETSQGQVEFDPTQSVLNGPYMQLDATKARAVLNPGFSQARDFASPSLGSYLVRSEISIPVPEPTTAVLLGLGMAGLAWRGRGASARRS